MTEHGYLLERPYPVPGPQGQKRYIGLWELTFSRGRIEISDGYCVDIAW